MDDSSQKFATICANVLQLSPEEIVDSLSPLSTPSWDSFNALTLVSELEHGFNVHFTQKEVRGAKNIGDVKNMLRSRGIEIS